MEFPTITEYFVIFWSGQISDAKLRFDTKKEDWEVDSVYFHSAVTFDKKREKLYCCAQEGIYQVREGVCRLILLRPT